MIEELNMIYDECRSSNQKSMERLDFALSKIRAGKATPSMLNSVTVDYYGTMTPLSQVANVNTLDGRTITVQPWESTMLNNIATGIINSNLGFAPQNNGEMIIISVPPLTEERRRDLVKMAKSECETIKVAVRNNRKDSLDMVKDMKNEGLSEDMAKDAEGEIQNITDAYVKKIDDMYELKEKDIMTI